MPFPKGWLTCSQPGRGAGRAGTNDSGDVPRWVAVPCFLLARHLPVDAAVAEGWRWPLTDGRGSRGRLGKAEPARRCFRAALAIRCVCGGAEVAPMGKHRGGWMVALVTVVGSSAAGACGGSANGDGSGGTAGGSGAPGGAAGAVTAGTGGSVGGGGMAGAGGAQHGGAAGAGATAGTCGEPSLPWHPAAGDGCTRLLQRGLPGMVVDPTTTRVTVDGGVLAKNYYCSGTGAGWHYDDDDAPTQIVLCDATCLAAGTVEVFLGCPAPSTG